MSNFYYKLLRKLKIFIQKEIERLEEQQKQIIITNIDKWKSNKVLDYKGTKFIITKEPKIELRYTKCKDITNEFKS